MPLEPDPNKKLEENLKKDGEFLRDVDKGHTPTETGLDLDLGIVRDEHAEVMEELGAVADAGATGPPPETPLEPPSDQPPLQAREPTVQEAATEQPASEPESFEPPEPPQRTESATPPPAPALQQEHEQTIGEMRKVAGPSQVSKSAPAKAPATPPATQPPPKATGRFGTEDLRTEHARSFVEMGRIVLDSRPQPEQPTPITSTVPDMERLAHPGFDQAVQLEGGMRSYIEEVRAALAEVREFARLMAIEHRQFRHELNDIRGYVERSRLL